MLFAEFVARMGEERLPQRVMFGELVRGKGYSGRQEKNSLAHLKEDVSVLGTSSKGGKRLLTRPADGFDEYRRKPSCSCGNGMRRRDAELQSDAQRPRQLHPPSASPLALGGGGRGGEKEASCTRD